MCVYFIRRFSTLMNVSFSVATSRTSTELEANQSTENLLQMRTSILLTEDPVL